MKLIKTMHVCRYAPVENPTICVAVVLENAATSGGKSAVPIAKNIIRKFLK